MTTVEMQARADWPDPTPEMLTDPRFQAVWGLIKGWDISTDPVGTEHRMYSGATGTHVRAILDALGTPDAGPGEPDRGFRGWMTLWVGVIVGTLLAFRWLAQQP